MARYDYFNPEQRPAPRRLGAPPGGTIPGRRMPANPRPTYSQSVGFDPFAGLFNGTNTAEAALAALPPPKPTFQQNGGLRGLIQRIGNGLRRGRQARSRVGRSIGPLS